MKKFKDENNSGANELGQRLRTAAAHLRRTEAAQASPGSDPIRAAAFRALEELIREQSPAPTPTTESEKNEDARHSARPIG
jgi:hypothetical protein